MEHRREAWAARVPSPSGDSRRLCGARSCTPPVLTAPAWSARPRTAYTLIGQARLRRIVDLIWNFGLDELRKQGQRFLPAEIASLGWDDRPQSTGGEASPPC